MIHPNHLYHIHNPEVRPARAKTPPDPFYAPIEEDRHEGSAIQGCFVAIGFELVIIAALWLAYLAWGRS